MYFDWTPERVELTRNLWMEGWSASKIAERLGDISRSAVIGKLSRIGVPKRETPTRTVKTRTPKPRTARPKSKAAPTPLREALTLSLPPLDPARQVDAIGDGECRYICGDPRDAGWAYCGRATDAGPWCKHHRWLVASPEIRRTLQQEQQQGMGT